MPFVLALNTIFQSYLYEYLLCRNFFHSICICFIFGWVTDVFHGGSVGRVCVLFILPAVQLLFEFFFRCFRCFGFSMNFGPQRALHFSCFPLFGGPGFYGSFLHLFVAALWSENCLAQVFSTFQNLACKGDLPSGHGK